MIFNLFSAPYDILDEITFVTPANFASVSCGHYLKYKFICAGILYFCSLSV